MSEKVEPIPTWKRRTFRLTQKRDRVQKVRWIRAQNYVRQLNRQQAARQVRDLRKRVEHLFAEAKEWHGLRRARGRGLWRVQSQVLLTAITQNLKRMAISSTATARRGRRSCHHSFQRLYAPSTYPAFLHHFH
ncbi:hypothetical protein GCM10007416_34640 [Kroppenstedtia guangzhouensis]|uniref:Transposase DDE domain-containing protein n=1 Tax=Kroppenstedtia guangzhouensis TaxID=1274356 RepID=A0ABQ1H4Q6_9BACL|nr:hypothetical protein GCM10007416_34640 [Kroppenstedtia guangzhouensis]